MRRAAGWLGIVLALASAAVAVVAGAAAQKRPERLDVTAVLTGVTYRIVLHGQGMDATLWLGSADGGWLHRKSDEPRPTASAIKTFYLVELFDAYRGRLDRPLAETAAVLADDAHPAISHFTAAEHEEIRRVLGGATVRRVGEVMMGTAPASNAVYNAAANLTTAVLGGPEALGDRIHRRHPAFAGVAPRRYMLRDRKEHGDNEAPAVALAALYEQLAARRLPGLDEPTMTAVREAMRRADDARLGRHFAKDGDLDSDPLTRVKAGWFEGPKGTVVYVVMATQPAPGPAGRAASGEALDKSATAIADTLIDAAAEALP
jgi:hypothetical protein